MKEIVLCILLIVGMFAFVLVMVGVNFSLNYSSGAIATNQNSLGALITVF